MAVVLAQTARAVVVAAAVAGIALDSIASVLAIQGQTVDLVAFVLGSTVRNARVTAWAASVALVQNLPARHLEDQPADEERP